MNCHQSRHFHSILFLLLSLSCVSLSGCYGGAPGLAPRRPYYTTERKLEVKAALITSSTMALVDNEGLLCYRAVYPFSNRQNYLDSHNIADAPAWQGALMGALALEQATTNKDRNAELQLLANGLLKYYEVTGTPGLFGRSMIADYKGPRLQWMATQEIRPTRYWIKGPTGAWWRNGLAKGHFGLAIFGCAVPLALHRQGKIKLSDKTQQLLIDFLLPAVRRFVKYDFQLVDQDNQPTEYGNLGPQVVNGFNMLLTLHALAAAAPYDDQIRDLYQQKLHCWRGRMDLSLNILGTVVHWFGHNRIEKPSFSDMQLISLSAFALSLYDNSPSTNELLRNCLGGLWQYVQYERNVPFTLAYKSLNPTPSPNREIQEVLVDLHDYPVKKQPLRRNYTHTNEVQPLCNRPINTHYWKASPYHKAIGQPGESIGMIYSGQDYLLGYWLGRYIGVIQPDQH